MAWAWVWTLCLPLLLIGPPAGEAEWEARSASQAGQSDVEAIIQDLEVLRELEMLQMLEILQEMDVLNDIDPRLLPGPEREGTDQ